MVTLLELCGCVRLALGLAHDVTFSATGSSLSLAWAKDKRRLNAPLDTNNPSSVHQRHMQAWSNSEASPGMCKSSVWVTEDNLLQL
jgi:hypothetical protein